MTEPIVKCRDCEAQLCAYIDDALTFDERRAVEEHLLGCAACAGLHADAEFASRMLRSAPAVEAPVDLVADIIHGTIGYAGRAPTAASAAGPAHDGLLPRFFRPLFNPILQPRFAMSMAVSVLSFSMLTFQAQNLWRGWQESEFSAAALVEGVASRIDAVRESAVEFYDAVMTVYELQTGFDGQPAQAPQQEEGSE